MSTAKLHKIWELHGQKILTVLAIFLTAVVSFQAGKSAQKDLRPAEIKVSLNQSSIASNPAEEKIKTLGETVQRKGLESQVIPAQALSVEASNESLQETKVECLLVGSKNSDKYHLSSCSLAAKIKSENRVCFSSEEDAHSKGYQPAKCCHK